MEKNQVGSLYRVNLDVGSDDININVNTRNIISRVKPEILGGLKSVAS